MCSRSNIQSSAKLSELKCQRTSRFYNEEQLIRSLEDNNGIKTIKRKQCLGRSNIISLQEENGTYIHDQDRMTKRCEEFYTNLYSTKQHQ